MDISVSPLHQKRGSQNSGSLPGSGGRCQFSRLLLEAGLNTWMADGQKGSGSSRTPVLAGGRPETLREILCPSSGAAAFPTVNLA